MAMSDISTMAHEGIPVVLVCREGSPVHAAAMRNPKIEVYPLKQGPGNHLDWTFIKSLRQILKKTQANLVHINNHQLLWNLLPALWGMRHVSVISNRQSFAERSFRNFFKFPLYRRLDYMVVLSELIKSSVLSAIPIHEKKIRMINLGLDFTRFDPKKVNAPEARKKWGANKDTIVIGCVGRMSPEVGQDTFLKAAAGLMKYSDWKMKFVLVSEDPIEESEEYIQELKQLVEQFHLQDVVHFASLEDNLPEMMASFDIFVMVGKEEVAGLGALEALAMERPVVLSRVAGAEEVVGYGRYGLLVRPGDAFDLQRNILTLLENPSTRLTMGSEGRKHVLNRFDKGMRYKKMLELYEKCLKRRYMKRAPSSAS